MCQYVLLEGRREELSETIGRVVSASDFFQNLILKILDIQKMLFPPPRDAFKNRDAFYNCVITSRTPGVIALAEDIRFAYTFPAPFNSVRRAL